MEFRILGPLEVDDGGRIVPLHGSKQRALLALLLLNAGEVVSDDRVLDELWGSEPPKSGRAALRVRLSELRKTLDGGRERDSPIVTRAPGYLIRVEPDQIDARRFERLLHEGSATLRAGAAEAAASALGEALALWRGPALADFAYESFARAEEARLEELRLTAREELLEAELALGRRAELVAELEALIEAEPLRERPRAQLMLALYRSGRAADALAAYRDARRVFNELGLEPSPRLADLERAILRHDPSLEHRAGSVPRHLGRDWREVKLATIVACALEPAHEAAAQVVARELEEAGGRVETLGGDSVVSIFGAPVAQEDHAWHALAALAAVRARAEGANVRAGVATGEIAVGGGSPLHGTALETARRLCEAAAPGAVLVAERTAAAIGTAVELGAPLTLDAGGEVALVARPLAAPSPPGVRAAVVTPFVGRTRELEALQAAYGRAVATGRPQLATIVGDAGVGKSRLARELWEWLADTSPPPLRQIGRCRQFGRGATYQPLAEVLRDRLRLRETDDADAVRAALGERQILGLTLGLEVAGLHPMTAREQLHTAWVRLLHELVAEQPVVLLLEDFHWAQQPLLDLVERFLAEVSGALTILATARPELLEARPSWGRRWDAETIWLEPLAGDDAARMLALLGGAELPNALRARLLERAEGNPFFLEELVSLLTALAREDGGELVPDTVQAVLAARLDLLPDVERAALQAASVIGRVFWPGPVCELVGVHPDLALLEARDFIRRRPTSSLEGEQAYAFKHALTCDVAYASLARTERVRLHASFAAWLERFGGGRDEHAPLLAHHYAEAVGSGHDDPAWADRPTEYQQTRRSALAWLRRAAQLAVARYEIDDGIALLEHALELESVARARVDLWRALARTYALKYDGDRFWSTMQRAIKLCTDRRTLAELYGELAFETSNRAGMWRRRPDRDLVDGWIAQALELADPGSEARLRALLTLSYWNPEGAADAPREAVEIAERLGDPELRSYAYDARAISLFVHGRIELGHELEKRRFELLDRIIDPEHVADIHYAPITASVWHGDFAEARYLARRHDEISAPLTAHHRIHGVAVLLEVEELAGCWETVLTLQHVAEVRVAANADTPCVRNARSLLVCALANVYVGRAEEAKRLERAAEEMRMEGFGHVLDTPRVRLALARGDLERVERLLAEPPPERGWHRGWLLISTHAARLDGLAALGRRDELEAWPRVDEGSYLEPFLLRALALVRKDGHLLERALAAFEALGLGWHAAETRPLL